MNDNLESKDILQAGLPVTAAKLETAGYTLSIPIYQRLFVWDETQIMRLLDDLCVAFERSRESYYYVGTITVWKDAANKIHVIDGQQRITFLSLFGAYASWDGFPHKEDELTIEYSGRPEDENDLSAIAKAGKDGNASFDKVVNKNFRIFIACMDKLKKNLENKKPSFHDFSEYVRQKCAFLISVLPDSYKDPKMLNEYFEVMNTAGRQLSPVDMIRGTYFNDYATVFDAALNFEKEYPEKEYPKKDSDVDAESVNEEVLTIEAILKDYSAVDMREQEPEYHFAHGVMSSEMMLLHVLKMADEKIVLDSNRILEIFENHARAIGKKQFIDNLVAYRRWMDANIIYYSGSENEGWKFRKGTDDEMTTCEEIAHKETTRRLQFQTMLTVSSDDKQEWVLNLYKEPRNGGVVELSELKKLDRVGHPELPALDDLKYGKIDRYWFWRLDYLLWEPKLQDFKVRYKLDGREVEAVKHYIFRRNRSIEHLHPQSDGEEWKTEEKDRFGNLAMISSSFNSEQGNDSVNTKFGRVKDQINRRELESIKLLLMFKIAENANGIWTTRNVEAHEKEMYSLLEEEFGCVKT